MDCGLATSHMPKQCVCLCYSDSTYGVKRWSDGKRGTQSAPKALTQLLYQNDKLINWGFAAPQQCADLLREGALGM